MYNPKEVLTFDGYEIYKANLIYLDKIIFHIISRGDDLHIDEEAIEALQDVVSLIPYLKEGDGEVYEY